MCEVSDKILAKGIGFSKKIDFLYLAFRPLHDILICQLHDIFIHIDGQISTTFDFADCFIKDLDAVVDVLLNRIVNHKITKLFKDDSYDDGNGPQVQ